MNTQRRLNQRQTVLVTWDAGSLFLLVTNFKVTLKWTTFDFLWAFPSVVNVIIIFHYNLEHCREETSTNVILVHHHSACHFDVDSDTVVDVIRWSIMKILTFLRKESMWDDVQFRALKF